MTHKTRSNTSRLQAPSDVADVLLDKIQELAPADDRQRSLQSQALSLALGLGQTRWLQDAQEVTSVSMPLLVVLVFWLTIIFISFGLFAPANATVFTALFVSALSVSAAIFLMLELYTPYAGLIQVSTAPLRVGDHESRRTSARTRPTIGLSNERYSIDSGR